MKNLFAVLSLSFLNVLVFSIPAFAQAKPAITTQPQNQFVTEGGTATFGVTATGQALKYKWMHDGGDLTNILRTGGATNATLVISNVVSSDAGVYSVLITNTHGATTSSNAVLAVNQKPVITSFSDVKTFPQVATRLIPFTVTDTETASSNLVVTVTSANQLIVTDSDIAVAGASSNRTIVITPSAQTGTARISVLVQDTDGGTASNSFILTVADFTPISPDFVPIEFGQVSWADYNNDGLLDAFIVGEDAARSAVLRLYQNLGNGTFTNATTSLPDLNYRCFDWGDYDNDGDLDLALGGTTNLYYSIFIYRNDNGVLTLAEQVAPFYTISAASIAWGDYNNDGKLDLLFGGYQSILFRNSGQGVLSNIATNFSGIYTGTAQFTDYDDDGFLDISINGHGTNNLRETHLYHNTGNGSFNEFPTALPGIEGFFVWGDYNGDGRSDVLLGGYNNGPWFAKVFRNDGEGTFTQSSPTMSLDNGTAAWGDYDGDGRLDFLYTDEELVYNRFSHIYRNTGVDTFVPGVFDFGEWANASIAAGDYDNDGAVDILLSGYGGQLRTVHLNLFHNDGAISNTPPAAPSALHVTINGNSATLMWDAALDAEQNGVLSYNIRIGTTPGGSDVVSAMSDSSGHRLLPQWGNAGYRLSHTITNLSKGTYYWTVQAIDNGFAGSTFAAEDTFTLASPTITQPPTNFTAVVGTAAQFSVSATGSDPLYYQWKWGNSTIPGATGSTLLLTNVQFLNEGFYSAVVSNGLGSVTSVTAQLRVVMPPSFVSTETNSVTAVAGTQLGINRSALGTLPMSYRWYFNEALLTNNGRITGANGAFLTITNVSSVDAGNYWVVASNVAGVATSAVTEVSVVFAPTITSQPTNRVQIVGGEAAFHVGAAGTEPLAYQWRFNGSNISGATEADLTLASIQTNQQGNYSAVVSNAWGQAVSSNANLTILFPPQIVVSPQSQTNDLGTTILLSATVTGTEPMNLQWYHDDIPLLDDDRVHGGTSNSLSISNAAFADTGDYVLVASNAFGVASAMANIIVTISPPTILQPPQDQNAAIGSNVVLSVTTASSGPVTYQWFFNGSALAETNTISGVTNNILTILGITTNDSGEYFVVVANEAGSVTSSVAVVTVGFSPSILQGPTDRTNVVGTVATFSAVVDGTPSLAYRWQRNGTNLFDGTKINGATTSLLTVSNVTKLDAGTYTVVVTNLFGTNSASGLLTVLQPPSFVVQPASRSIILGTVVSLSASVTGDQPMTYQWQLNGTDRPDASNPGYSITVDTTNLLGRYRLIVSNAAGVAVSSEATISLAELIAWGRNDYSQTNVPSSATNIIAISAGGQDTGLGHTLALRADGTVVAWGNNSSGQTNVPASATNIVAIAAGGSHSLALRSDGTLLMWGSSLYNLSFPPSGATNIISIAAGGTHSMALRSDGTLFAWGNSSAAQTSIPFVSAKVVGISCGTYHSLALREDGIVTGWSQNSYGESSPVSVANASSIAAGYMGNIALRSNATMFAWGYNGFGQTNIPASASNTLFTAVAAGYNFNLALRTNRTVLAWGSSSYGQTNVPAQATNVIAISAGGNHGVALFGTGRPIITTPPVGGAAFVARNFTLRGGVLGDAPISFQWLFNGTAIADATNATLVLSNITTFNAGRYQLVASNSLGVATSLAAPVTVVTAALPGIVKQLLSGTNYLGSRVRLSIPVNGSGPIKFQWKFNGTNITGATNEELVLDPILTNHVGAYALSITNSIGTATSSTGIVQQVTAVRTWGYQPIEVPTRAFSATAVVASSGHYLALRPDGQIAGWGTSSGYGYGETNPPASLSNVVTRAIAAASSRSLALKADGTLVEWGYTNYLGSIPSSAVNVTAISAGPGHDLALRNDGTVIAWGNNSYGQTNVPASATNIVAIAAGDVHSVALRDNGTVVVWGYSYNNLTNPPATATNVIAVAAGYYFTMVLRADGTVVCWGSNNFGSTNVPVGLSNVVAIAASSGHCTALRSDGSVVSWGSYLVNNTSGTVVRPADLTNIIQIADGGDRSICLLGTRAPAVTIHPFNQQINLGSTTVLIAKAVSAATASYQWFREGIAIPGATNSQLVISNAQSAATGSYQLAVTNQYGSATSKAAKLTVSIPINTAMDTSNLNWTNTGSVLWFGEPDTTHDGVDAVRSGAITHNQECILTVPVFQSGGGQISFWWKVSSELGYDVLEFRTNGVLVASISGEVDWQQRTFPLGISTTTLQWRYSKDGSATVGTDAAWLDELRILPNPPVITRQPLNVSAQMGATVQFYPFYSGGNPMTFRWHKDDTNDVGGNSSMLTLSNVSRADVGRYSITISNANGVVTSSNAILTVTVPQKLTAGLLPDGTFQLSAKDANGASLTNVDAAKFEAQFSTNLNSWTTLSNGLILTNGSLILADPDVSNSANRFYRIIEH